MSKGKARLTAEDKRILAVMQPFQWVTAPGLIANMARLEDHGCVESRDCGLINIKGGTITPGRQWRKVAPLGQRRTSRQGEGKAC